MIAKQSRLKTYLNDGRGARLVIGFLTGLCSFYAVWIALFTVTAFANTIDHEGGARNIIWQALKDRSLLPVLLAVALVSYFATDSWLANREGRPRTHAPGTSGLLITGSAITLVLIGAFWAMEGRNLRIWWDHPGTDFMIISWCILPGALLGGLIVAIAMRSRIAAPAWLALAPPLAAIVVTAVTFQAEATRMGDMASLPTMAPTPRKAVTALAILAGAVTGLGLWERRSTGQVQRVGGLLLAGTWLIATAVQHQAVRLHTGCLCTHTIPARIQIISVAGLIAVWALAMTIRLLVHRDRRAASAKD